MKGNKTFLDALCERNTFCSLQENHIEKSCQTTKVPIITYVSTKQEFLHGIKLCFHSLPQIRNTFIDKRFEYRIRHALVLQHDGTSTRKRLTSL